MLRTSKIFILIVSLISLQSIFSQNLKKTLYKSSLRNQIFELNNGKVRLFVEDNTGKFYIKTMDNKNILYYDTTRTDFFTSHLNIKIDDSVFSNDANVSKLTATSQMLGNVKIDTNFASSQYAIKNGKILVTQKMIPVNYYGLGALVAEVTVKNSDNIPHNVGALMEYDLQVNRNDGVNFTTNDGIIKTDTILGNNELPFLWRAYEKAGSDTNFIVQGNLKGLITYSNISGLMENKNLTRPDAIIFDEWEKLHGVTWDYNKNTAIPFSDGAIILKWNERIIPAASSVTFTIIIGEAKGPISNGDLILNSYNQEELSYNGNRYTPDPVEFNTIVYNNSQYNISNISSSIILPYGLFTDSLEKKAIPSEILPYNNGIIKYSLHPKMSAERKVSTIKLNITSSAGSNSSASILRIPAAPDADTLDPIIIITKKSCSFSVNITDKRTNDKGIDSLSVLSVENIIYSYHNPVKGDTAMTISGSLKNAGQPGSVHFRAFDMAGNVADFTISLDPDIIGFDNESVGSGNLVFIPFKMKNNNPGRMDTTISCKIKYDPLFLRPAALPVEIQRDDLGKTILSDLLVKNNEISFKLSNMGGFNQKTLAFLQFNVLSNVKESTNLIIEDMVINNNPDYCVYKSNSNIAFNSSDHSTPRINIQQFGSRFFGFATDNNTDDKGIYNIYLSNSSNAILFADPFEPGVKKINITIAAADSALPANGNLAVIDGSGNYSSYYFSLEPVLIKTDTVIAASKEKFSISPTIYGELPDITLHEYVFEASYDTNIVSARNPVYDKSGTTGSDYTVIADTSKKGIIKISASGSSFLTLGKVLNLLFEMKTGKDTLTIIHFDYFYLKNGLKPVHTIDAAVIRKNNDDKPPLITAIQKRNTVSMSITEEDSLDLGIDSVKFDKILNFSVSMISKSNTKYIYSLTAIDSSQSSSCSVYAYDLLGNLSKKEFSIHPARLLLPDSIFCVGDSISIPLSIKPANNFVLHSISFKLKLADNFFAVPDTLNIASAAPLETICRYDKKSSFLSVFSHGNIAMDTSSKKLFDFKLKLHINNGTKSEIYFSDIILNEDSLFAFGNILYAAKAVSDTTKPDINITKYKCEYNINVKDLGGVDSVWIKGLNNIKDTIIFITPFQKHDTTAQMLIQPVDSKKPSKFTFFAMDSLGNISSKADSVVPVFVSLPAKTKISAQTRNIIPLSITGNDKNLISDLSIMIKYNENLMLPDTNVISATGTLLDKSNVSFTLLPPNTIKINAKGNISQNSLPLVKLNFIGVEGDSLASSISIESLVINKDSICSYAANGIIYRSKLNVINLSIEPVTKGQIGKEVKIPINISGDYTNYTFTNIKIRLSFNPSLLKPVAIASGGSGLEGFSGSMNYDISGKLVLNYSGSGVIQGNKPLTYFSARVLLGTEDSTIIKIDSFKIEYSNNLSIPQITFADGKFIITDRYEWQQGLKLKKDYLYQNHPNPYNSTTIIRFSLSSNGKTSLIIYDILGREIAKPVDNILEAGDHSINFTSNNLPSGVYYYELRTDSYSQIRKMVLLK